MLGARTILRMRQQNLHVADPQKLLAGAQIDMLLFDKTGTLTIGQVGNNHSVARLFSFRKEKKGLRH